MFDIRPISLVERLEAQLSREAWSALQTLVQITARRGRDVFLVGGAVRDLVLERPGVDLDLAIETDVEPIVTALATVTRGRVVVHPRFGTATVTGPGFRIDVARTRKESYPHPGSLPVVEPATIAEDLIRRDFSINAMALRLSTKPGLLSQDRTDGDLIERRIRVLHELSFQDDATRMLRAVRYAARLDFNLEPQTEAWLQRDLSYVDTISGPRLRRELALIFDESSAVKAAKEAAEIGILGAIHPVLSLTEDVAQRWRDAFDGAALAPRDETGFCVLTATADDDAITSLSARLHLTGRFEDALRDAVRLQSESSKLAAMRHDPVAAVETLQHAAPSAVWATGIVAGGHVAATCESYLREWRHVKPLLRGDDVTALGVQPGVAVGDALRALRDARLRGVVASREDEEAVVHTLVKSNS